MPYTHKVISSNLIRPTGNRETFDDLAQLVEQYPDTVQVDSSSLSVITNWFVAQLERVAGF